MIIFQQRRDFGEKINASFTFTMENLRGLGLSLLLIVGPVALVGGIISGYAQSTLLTGTSPGTFSDPSKVFAMYAAMFSGPWLVGLVLVLLSYVLVNVVTFSYIRLYQQRGGQQPITVGEVWAATQPFIGSGVLLTIAVSLLAGVGMIFLVLPGLYLLIVFSITPAILVFEGQGVGESISRSFRLISGNWWATFGLLFVMSLIVSIMSMIFTLPAGIVGGLFGAGVVKDISILTTVFTALGTVGSMVLQGLNAVATAFQYYDLKEEKEGTGLLAQINAIGETDQPGTLRPTRNEEGEY